MTATSLLGRVAGQAFGESVSGIRPDIQALRALAVGAVLVYHLWPGCLTGGYVGVDVFFVISGFLITSHLLREVECSGTLRVGLFWARRARRLLPSSLMVLLATTVAIVFLMPSSQWGRSLGDVVGSSLYVENWRLAALSVDYLGAEAAASPVQHFWTLSVEEQFYVALPLLLLLALGLSRIARLSRRAVMAGSIGMVAAVSLWLSIDQTPWTAAAYFTTHTRAWEFAAGALLAFVPPLTRGKHLVAVVGVQGIATAMVAFTDSTSFPGSAALLPVLGTALAIWAGRDTWLAWAGRLTPVAAVGRSSYAIYLWHWPMIVLVPFAIGGPLTSPVKLAVAAGAVLLGWLTTVWWEEPVRFSTRLLGGRRPRVVALWSALATAVVAISALSAVPVGVHRSVAAQEAVDAVFADLYASGCAGAGSLVTSGCDPLAPAPELRPALDGLERDRDDWDKDCWGISNVETVIPICQFGDGKGPTFLVLGDSHSGSFWGLFERLAVERGWTFLVAGHPACYLTTADIQLGKGQQQELCHAWREGALEAVAAGGYDALIVTESTQSDVLSLTGSTEDETKVAGLVDAWALRPSADIPVIAIRDNPTQLGGIDTCLDREGPGGGVECGLPETEALLPDLQGTAVEADPNAYLLDFTDLYCVDGYCPAVIGGILVYRPDGHHLTATYVDTLTPMLGDSLDAILREQGIADGRPAGT